MTIKEAFEKLAESVKKSMKNPFFVMRNLGNDLEDISKNIEGGGSDVEVIPAQDSGYLVGNVKVDGEDNYLYAPPQIIPPHVYSDTEILAGVWFHDGISENIYEKTFKLAVNVGKNVLNHGIANFKECFRISGQCKYNNESEMLPLPYVSINPLYCISCGNVTPTTFTIETGSGFSSIEDCYITLLYTKNNT